MTNKAVTGEVVVSLSTSADAAGSPDWLKLAPRGRTQTRDGRSYSFNPETLAARFAADSVKLPVDFEHGTIHRAGRGERADAIGWIEEMEARADGLYGRVEWLAPGRAALAAKTHRYLSPTFNHDRDGSATWLHSVALVTAPALAQMPALAHADPDRDDADARAALGLPSDADDATVVAAIRALKAKAGGTATANATVEALAMELSQERRSVLAARVNEKVEKAISGGFISPAMREWALLSCVSNEAAFDTFMTQVGPVFGYLFKETPALAGARILADQPVSESSDAHRIAAQLGIDPKSLG